MNHFDKLEIAQDFDNVIVYLEAQTSLMPDKLSQKYIRMKSIVQTMKNVKTAYDEVYRENMVYINELIHKKYFTVEELEKMVEDAKPKATPLHHLTLEDARGLLASIKLKKPEIFDPIKHSHLIQKK